VLYTPAPRHDAGQLAVDLDRSFRKEIGLTVTQFVVSDQVENGVIDLRPIPAQPEPANGWRSGSRVRIWRHPPGRAP
jgi:hypothetical protein